ncbi:MAG: CHAT domain-containing protein [Candidatus Binatia bacterium]
MRLNRALASAITGFFLFACSSAGTAPKSLSSQPEISPEAQRLFQKANTLNQEGKFLEAARTGELALEASHNALPVGTSDAVLLEIAGLYEKGGSPTVAIRVLNTVLQHTPAAPEEKLLHGQASYRLANLLHQNGKLNEALRHATTAENLARELDRPSALVDVLTLTAFIDEKLDRHKAAIRALKEALAVLPHVDPPRPQAHLLILNKLASVYMEENRYSEAEATASEYLKDAKALGDLGHQAEALFLQGDLKYRQGDLPAAVDPLFAAARKASEQPDRIRAMSYFRFGLAILEDLKKYDEMKDALLVALDRYDQVFEDPNDKAFLLSKLGQAWIQLGVYDLGNANLFRAYQLYRDGGSDREAAESMIHLGILMNSLQNPTLAYSHFTIALKHASKAKAADFLAVVHKHLGVLYARVGWYVDAYREYDEARKIYQSLGRTNLVYSVEFLILNLYQSMGDRNKIREQLGRLEKYGSRDPSLRRDYLYWVNLATTYSALEEKERAREHASHALIAAREAKDTQGEILALKLLANYGSAQESIPILQQAYSIAKQNQMVGEYWGIQSSLGWAFLKEEKFAAAIEAFNNSIAATESAVGRIPFGEARISFAAKSLSPYDGLILALYRLYKRGGDPDLSEKALLVHEKSRAREFDRTLTESRREEIAKTLPKDAHVEVQALSDEIDSLEREFFKLAYSYERNEQLLEKKKDKLRSKRERYATLMRMIQARYPQYAITKRRDLGNVRNLPVRPGEALLVYRDIYGQVFLWVITASLDGAKIQLFEFIGGKTLQVNMRKALGGFMKNDPASASRAILGLLSDELLKPALATLSGASHLTIVRDGFLEFFPFEMLPMRDDARLLVLDRWTVSYYPSLLSMVVNRSARYSEKGVAKMALLVGDAEYAPISNSEADGVQEGNQIKLRSGESLGELPFSAAEIQRIDELFRSRQIPTTVLKGSAASESHIKRLNLREYKYIHFAVHGLLANEVFGVREPSLALTVSDDRDDSFLTASEVMGLKLNAELVVLSACRTALGEYHAGEGITNLARSFMSAGAESVIVSQWAVADQSTAQLMIELYENMDRGLSLPEALKAAKTTLRKQHPSPYYWAPFILVGG